MKGRDRGSSYRVAVGRWLAGLAAKIESASLISIGSGWETLDRSGHRGGRSRAPICEIDKSQLISSTALLGTQQ